MAESRWGLGERWGNTLRFLTFSVLHLVTYAANVAVLSYLVYYLVSVEKEVNGKAGYLALLALAHLIVGFYCVHLAYGDRSIQNCCLYVCASTTFSRFMFCLVLGLTQLIQLKVAFDKYTRREEMPMDTETDDEESSTEEGATPNARRAAIIEHRIPWAFPSKCFEGIFEGCVFAFVLLYAVLKIGWEKDDFEVVTTYGYYIMTISGLGSFCTVGVSMLNFDYHLSPAVQKTVDHSMRYTIIHAFFRTCEAGVRISTVVFAALAFRSCSSWMSLSIPYVALLVDYLFGVGMLIWLSAQEERQYASLKNWKGYLKRIVVAILTGSLLMLCNLTEFVDEADRRSLRKSAKTYSRFIRLVRFVELVAVLVLIFAPPCPVTTSHDSLFKFVLAQHKIIGLAFVLAIVSYYIMVLFRIHSLAIDDMDGIENNSFTARTIRVVLDVPGSITSTGSARLENRDDPLLGEASGQVPASMNREVTESGSEAVAVHQARDSDLPELLREDFVAAGTFYHAQSNEYCVARAPSLSFLLLSKGIHGSVANMVLQQINENEALPSDNIVPVDRMKMSDFKLEEKLGSGAYASVWKCSKKSTGEFFAMKRLVKNNYVRRKGAEAEFPRRERDTLLLAGRHTNIASLECAFETDSYWVLVTEFCDLGSLTKHVRRPKGGVPAEEAKDLGEQILAGLQHLHSQSILHRDVKPDNVALAGRPQAPTAKLIDFGFAKRAEARQSSTILGSYGYCAPEVDSARRIFGPLSQGADKHDERIDIYSYGILLFVLFVGREAVTDGPHRSLWTHSQFRGMLRDRHHPLWSCHVYSSRHINGGVLLKRMKDCWALEAISKLTETDYNARTRNCAEALNLRFFSAPLVSNDLEGGSASSINAGPDSFSVQPA